MRHLFRPSSQSSITKSAKSSITKSALIDRFVSESPITKTRGKNEGLGVWIAGVIAATTLAAQNLDDIGGVRTPAIGLP